MTSIPHSPRKPVLGLALGSGSARGWAHIGVIRALQEAGYTPDVVAGTSIGALVGSVYAGGNPETFDGFQRWVETLTWRDVLSFFDVGFSGGLIKGEKLMSFLADHFVDVQLADLKRPFACVATELSTGREVWLRHGLVVDAVRASIALPGLFAPALNDGRLLADGALVNPVPVSLCRALGADVVIAVDLGSDVIGRRINGKAEGNGEAPPAEWLARIRRWLGREQTPGDPSVINMPSMLDVMATSINIMQVRIARSRLAGEPADILIAPRLAELGMLDYDKAEYAIEEGHEATKAMLPMIRRILDQ
ncbi:MAG TPA: patatin-like phospholipase family protein [Rhodocyclaceae bacterium]|nr:patatin-like phospholipase family protein [Rhodocyclaceae bacterium]